MESHSLGLKRGTVQVVPYDPEWPQLFQEEKTRLEVALGNATHDIEHVGSTSIPGLAAKPIIDMIASVDDLKDYKKLITSLESLDYEFMPERVFEDRVFFPKGPRENRTHHLSLVVKNSPGWHDPIQFRDYLISHEDARSAYQTLKQKLAAKYPSDRSRYTQAKEAAMASIMRDANNEQPNKTQSAGGVVLNSYGQVLIVQEYGYFWGLPRGHIERGESPEEAARREIHEEADISQLEYVADLGAYERSTFDKNGQDNNREIKHMTFFLFKTKEIILTPQDKNITDARWIDPEQMSSLLIHVKDKEFYASILPTIRGVCTR